MRGPIEELLSGRRVQSSTRYLVASSLCFILLHLGARAAEHPVPLGTNPDSTVCIQCHQDKAKGKFVHTVIAAQGCSACHTVISKKKRTLVSLVLPPNELCFTCHEKVNDKVLHAPYAQGNCIVCHSPHASDWPKQLLAPPQELCMGCHVRSRLKIDPQKRTATVPWGITLPLDQFQGMPSLGLNQALTANHPVEGHPITGPNTDLGKDAPDITCLSCHQPHHSDRLNLLPPGFATATALCESCHREIDP